MEEIDFSELKIPVGRPEEDNVERVDMTDYLLLSKFRRKLNSFMQPWQGVLLKKTEDSWRTKLDKSTGKRYQINKYRENQEAFYGELLERFEMLGMAGQVILESEHPIKALMQVGTISDPNLLPKQEDNDEFIKILKEASL